MSGCIYQHIDDEGMIICEKYSDFQNDVISYCGSDGCKENKPSNADRIRAMSDIELAKALSKIHGTCVWCPVHEDCDGENCDGQLLDWLKEVSE